MSTSERGESVMNKLNDTSLMQTIIWDYQSMGAVEADWLPVKSE